MELMAKRVYGFDFRLVLGSGRTQDFKNSSGCCLHGTPQNITGRPGVSIYGTGWGSIWACMWHVVPVG